MGMKRRSLSSAHNPSTQRAWKLLRLALLWARKGGIMKCRLLMAELRLIPKHLKSLNPHNHQYSLAHYGERQLSFDETPVIHMRMSRPASLRFMIPGCMKPLDNDFDVDRMKEISSLYEDKEVFMGLKEEGIMAEAGEREEEGIDERAEEFINKFYRQVKLQRQNSYLQYTIMISREATV